MPAPEKIKTAYETLKANHKNGAGLTWHQQAAAPVLMGLVNGAADGGIPQKFQDYLNALTAVFLLTPDELSQNQIKLMAALAQLDGFGGFLGGQTEGVQTYRWLLDHSAKHGVTEEKLKNVVEKVNEATGLQIVLPPLAPSRNLEPTQSASRWIQDWKAELGTRKNKPDYPGRYFAKIMAVRMLAKSDRGYKDKLVSTQLTESAVNAKADELLANAQFQGFLQTMTGETLLRAESAVTGRGHCGGLDDMFRDYLRNLQAGKLTNEALLDRYMPSAKERIEALQRQAAQKLEEERETSLAAEAAEITVLRNMVRAERNKKLNPGNLNFKIPTFEQSNLEKQTFTLRNSQLYLKKVGLAGSDEYRELVTKGHGGQLVDKLREAEKTMPQNERVKGLLYENTLGGHLQTIRQDAVELYNKISDARDKYEDDSPEVEKLVREAKGLLAEYLALDMLCRDSATRQIDLAKLEQNVPWGKLASVKANPDNNPVVKLITEDMGPVTAQKGLQAMAELSHEDYMEVIQTQYRQAQPTRQPQAGDGVAAERNEPQPGIRP